MLSLKMLILLACSFAIGMTTPVDKGVMTGGPVELTLDAIKDAQKELQVSLNHLASGDAPHYKVSKVISATMQVVSGVSTKMNVDLVNTEGEVKNCNVEVWARPWLPNGIKTNIECPQQKTLVDCHTA